MKKLVILFAISLTASSIQAQDLPKPSPKAEVKQSIGLNKMKIEYSRPGVKDRKIFGDLVPYGKVWRLGANAPTMLTTDKPVTFENTTIQPGTYAIFAIPNKKEWTVVINSDIEQWGAGNYDESKNLVSMTLPAKDHPFTESLSITFQDISANDGEIVIAWDKVSVAIPFTVDTHAAAVANIDKAIEDGKNLEVVYSNAAGYYRDAKQDLKTAMSYVDKSIAVKEYHSNMFLKARILAETGKKEEAIEYAEKALQYAVEAGHKGYESFIKETIERWKQ